MNTYELQTTNYEIPLAKILCVLCIFCGAILSAAAQSTNQSYPTAITSNEISGKIPARDIGDSRLTNYFYAFNGNQGDIFINVQTSNFNGDIDIFTAGNLKPLTKITIYSDDATGETGRVVYLRQPTKLVLRIEGRPPNDDAATFRIKFAGSFQPIEASAAENSAPETPAVKSDNQTDVRVNSVGTIVEVKPKPLPPPKETIAKKETKPRRKKAADTAKNKKDAKVKAAAGDESKDEEAENKEITNEEKTEQVAVEKSVAEVEKAKENPSETAKEITPIVVDDNTAKAKEPPTDTENSSDANKEKPAETAKNNRARSGGRAIAKSKLPAKTVKPKEPNPLENVHLIILLKDGTRIERAMSEVTRFAVVRGVLTVTTTDGAIKRYSILDVAKMTVE